MGYECKKRKSIIILVISAERIKEESSTGPFGARRVH
jgi:hypothetical protein